MGLDPLVIAWLTPALAGALYSVRLLMEYLDTKGAVSGMRRNGIGRRLAKMWTGANVTEESLTLTKQVVYILIGIAAAFGAGRYAISLGLILSAILSVVRSRYRWVKWVEWRGAVLAEHPASATTEVDSGEV
jgi:hypothetical protein